VEARLSLVTLGVGDLDRSIEFYEDVLGLPRLETPAGVAFFEHGKTWLSLFPRRNLARDAGVPPESSGFPGFTLAHNVRSKAEVVALMDHVAARGDRLAKPARAADWGGPSGNLAAPDGYCGKFPGTRGSGMCDVFDRWSPRRCVRPAAAEVN
jgi:catechol 2,3-dioxygenase-like lactoylglutathione lyase family enzyme